VPVSHSCCSASNRSCSPRYACSLLDCKLVSYTDNAWMLIGSLPKSSG